MSIRKSHDFLALPESDDDDASQGYDSEQHEEGRGGIGGRASKRQKVTRYPDNESTDGLSDENLDRSAADQDGTRDNLLAKDLEQKWDDGGHSSNAPDAQSDNDNLTGHLYSPLKAPSAKHALRAQNATRKSGVLYISRVPPFMKPHTLKHFLQPHASKGIGRIFLTPEDHDTQAKRRKAGGNKKKSFTDGWVEFVSKSEAKMAADMLNGHTIGGKKGNFYHDDLWNMKYLKGFKWSHLTEQIANENAERAARVREEIRRTRKENQEFLKQIEAGKVAETNANREARRMAKGQTSSNPKSSSTLREFKQRKAQSKDNSRPGHNGDGRNNDILSSIF